jgi:TolB-like protein
VGNIATKAIPVGLNHFLTLGSWIRTALVLGMLAACASESRMSVYRHPNADLGAFKRVAVLPLDNLTTDRFASERVREVLVVELSSMETFQVVESGEVNRVLRALNITNLSEAGPELIGKIGKELKAEALLLGSVMEFRERQAGALTSPEVSISLRMVEAETGTVIWSASDSRKGMGVWTRLFGVGEESQTQAMRELLRKLLDTLYA